MAIFQKEVLQRRRAAVGEVLTEILKNDECALFYAGKPIGIPGGLDQTYGFIPHPTYFWLTGNRAPAGVSFFSRSHGWIDFVHFQTREEKFWEGSEEPMEGRDISEFEAFMKVQPFRQTYRLGQFSQGENACSDQDGESTLAQIHLRVNALRRVKDAAEIELIECIANIANKGYEKLRSFIRPGVSERQIQIEFEAEVQRHGADGLPYGTIVGSGVNSAILHAVPTAKIVEAGEMVLIDAGAQIADYCVDITRVFPADGKFSSQQRDLYDIVKASQVAAIAASQVGVQWHEVHRLSAKVIAEGLRNLGLVTGDTEAFLDTGGIAMFYPHGVGHLVGLRVRDVGVPENTSPKKYCGAGLRVDLALQEGFVITVEPGCYFIKALIDDPEMRSRNRDFVNWAEIEKWRTIGGVRIEDDILITSGAPKNLTSVVPKF